MQTSNPNPTHNFPTMSSISLNYNEKYLFKPTFFPGSSCNLTSLNQKYRVQILCKSSCSNSRICRINKIRNSSGLKSQNLVEYSGRIGKWVFNFIAAAVAVSSICFDFDSPAFAESLTIAFPVSRSLEVTFYIPFFSISDHLTLYLSSSKCLFYLIFSPDLKLTR